MNYSAWVGYWFYNASSNSERAALFSSYGLLTIAPDTTGIYRKIRGMIGRGFKYILGG